MAMAHPTLHPTGSAWGESNPNQCIMCQDSTLRRFPLYEGIMAFTRGFLRLDPKSHTLQEPPGASQPRRLAFVRSHLIRS